MLNKERASIYTINAFNLMIATVFARKMNNLTYIAIFHIKQTSPDQQDSPVIRRLSSQLQRPAYCTVKKNEDGKNKLYEQQ